MAEAPDQTSCFFCQRELGEGQGRYRFFQGSEQVDCCLTCFDEARRLYLRLPDEQGTEPAFSLAEKDS